MRICIYGAGAMGTVLGAFLTQREVPVDLVSRNQAHVDALKEHGAHISGQVDFGVPVSAMLPDEMHGEYDLIFLMTKQRENKEIVSFLKHFLGVTGVICTMQNGLPERSVADVIGADRTYGCAVVWGANMVNAGEAELTSDPSAMSFSVGAFGNGERTEEIADILSRVGTVHIQNNLIGARWAKLLTNASFSGLSVVTGKTFGEIAKNVKSRRIAQKIIKEGIDVARVAGIKIESLQGHDIARIFDYHNPIKKLISFLLLPVAMKHHAGLVSGMLLDLQRGRKTEIDFITGIVCRYGREYGVETPTADAVVELVHGIENGLYEICMENLDFIA